MTTFKVGDEVIIANTIGGDSSHADDYWRDRKTVLKVIELRPGKRYSLVVGVDDNISAVIESWLKALKRKHPENAISRVQALKLAKQLHPEATHIAMCKDTLWWIYKNIINIADSGWKCDRCYSIDIPIKYNGPWEDSTYPRIYFSPPKTFEGLDHTITIKEDGAIELGCGDVIPSDTIDAIIKHRIEELTKFPKTRKKKTSTT